MLDPAVFRAYGVRGTYPDDLDEDGAYAIGRAYVDEFESRQIAVGRDMRLAAAAIATPTIEGAADAGAEVLDLGLVGTEMLDFAVGDQGLDGGIMVTGAGMTLVRRGGLPVGDDSGLPAVRERALSGEWSPSGARGQVRELDVWPGFVDRVLGFVEPDTITPLRVAIDAGNGMAGAMLAPVLERLPVELVPAESRADLRVVFDGDRCDFSDDAGEPVPADFVTALLAESLLERHPGEKVIYDLRASWAVPETVRRAGGVPIASRVGPAFVRHLLRKEDGVFAGEVSGRYYFRDFWHGQSQVVPVLLLLELVSRRGKRLSELLRPYRERYFLSGELSLPVADAPLKLQELKERFGREGRVSHLDGVSVEADDWRLNVRPSSTEPLLRLCLEVRSQELLDEKRAEVLAVLGAS